MESTAANPQRWKRKVHFPKQVRMLVEYRKKALSTCTFSFSWLRKGRRTRSSPLRTSEHWGYDISPELSPADKEAKNKQTMGSKGLRNFTSLYASEVTGKHYTKRKSCSGSKV